jgi:hypothetical protein
MRPIRASRLSRVAAASAVAILATGGVVASATAASAAKVHHPKPEATTLSIKNRVIAHSRHHADAITGVLSARRKGVAGETITLKSRSSKKPRWAVAGSATTSASGSVTFTIAPSAKTQYELYFAGDSAHRASHSNVITITVAHHKR